MRRHICLLLTVLLFLLSGCSSVSAKNSGSGSISTEEQKEAEGSTASTSETQAAEKIIQSLGEVKAEDTSNKIRVALIDSGISTQVIEAESIETGWNYVTGSTDTEDTYNHGTGSAYIIQTVAPYVELCPLVCTHYESGKLEQVSADTVAQMISDAAERYHCQVICIELGIDKKNKNLEAAVKAAEKAGVVVIAPVGNGYEEESVTYYPAAYETVIGVGSVDVETGEVSAFSQRGKAVKIVGPAAAATKTITGQDVMDAGTSVSTAYVTGCVVRLLEREPNLTPKEVRQRLYDTAVDIGAKGYDTDSGWGFADLSSVLGE